MSGRGVLIFTIIYIKMDLAIQRHVKLESILSVQCGYGLLERVCFRFGLGNVDR